MRLLPSADKIRTGTSGRITSSGETTRLFAAPISHNPWAGAGFASRFIRGAIWPGASGCAAAFAACWGWRMGRASAGAWSWLGRGNFPPCVINRVHYVSGRILSTQGGSNHRAKLGEAFRNVLNSSFTPNKLPWGFKPPKIDAGISNKNLTVEISAAKQFSLMKMIIYHLPRTK